MAVWAATSQGLRVVENRRRIEEATTSTWLAAVRAWDAGATQQDLADVLGCSVRTVGARLREYAG